jgi:hypothetical protein
MRRTLARKHCTYAMEKKGAHGSKDTMKTDRWPGKVNDRGTGPEKLTGKQIERGSVLEGVPLR